MLPRVPVRHGWTWPIAEQGHAGADRRRLEDDVKAVAVAVGPRRRLESPRGKRNDARRLTGHGPTQGPRVQRPAKRHSCIGRDEQPRQLRGGELCKPPAI
jgi:hypothetical protein